MERKTIAAFTVMLVLSGSSAWAALSTAIVWEVRTTGLDTNGGGFNPSASGTDWTKQNGPQYSVADGVTAGTTTITSATAAFGTDVVGNLIYVSGGTGSITAGWYEITARASTTSITVDRSTGLTTGTGVTLHIGGGLLTPAQANTSAVAGNLIYIKAGTYTISSQIQTSNAMTWIGYNTTRTPFNTDATFPLWNCGTNGITMFQLHAGAIGDEIRNIEFNVNSKTGTTTAVYLANTFANAIRCKVTGFSTGFKLDWNDNRIEDCYASGCIVAYDCSANTPAQVIGCTASGGTTGFQTSTAAGTIFLNCIATGCGGVGFSLNTANVTAVNCSAYGCTLDNFKLNSAGTECRNCVSYGSSAKQFNAVGTTNHARLINCAGDAGGTGSNANFNAWEIQNFITLTANPYTNTAGGDYSLNNTTGGGATLRGLALPASFTGVSTTNALDIGAVQSQSTSGGGKKVGPGGGKVGMLDPRGLSPFPRSRSIIVRKAG